MNTDICIQIARSTRLLHDALEQEGEGDCAALCIYFSEWKALGPAGEYSDWYFGRDSEYIHPRRNGKRLLRHVHLPPTYDPEAMEAWNRKAERNSPKTSDSALIYTFDPTYGYLLIYIAREPEAHRLADMATPESFDLMNQFCDVAEAFGLNGSILI
jgi:hypothetical protein